MASNQYSEDKFEQLRKKAEKLVQQQPGKTRQLPLDMEELLHELKVYQAELEIQNEELKNSQQELSDLYYKYEDLYESAPVGYITLNPKGIIKEINKSAAGMLGKHNKNITGTQFTNFIHQNWIDVFLNLQRTAGQTGDNQSIEVPVKSDAKSNLWVHINLIADRNNKTEVYNWKLTLVDITTRKNYEKELIGAREKAKESEERLKQAQQTAQLGSWKIDIINDTLYCSDEIYRIFDRQAQEFKATYEGFLEFIHPDDRKMVNEAYTNSLQTGKPYDIIYRVLMKNGKVKYVQEKCKTTFDESGKPLVSEGVVLDITKLKEQENKLHKYSIKLEEANATKDRFISILGHDLRNSFNTILGYSDLLLSHIDQYDKENIKQFVSTVHNTAKHTYNLLNNLLEWSRIQRDKIPFNPQSTNMYYLVQEPFLLVNDSAEAKNIDIELDVPEQLEIEADRAMINTVIRNLLSNAIKFTHENGSIYVSVKKTAQNVEMEIADTGTGLDEATQNSLFKIGESTSKRGTSNEKGTGFGLLLCKEFIDKHHGTIHVESKPGEGSTFIVTLPLKQNNE